MDLTPQTIDYIRHVAYDEWNDYVKYLDDCGSVDNFIKNIHPDVIIELLSNCRDRLSDLAINIMDGMYKHYYDQLTDRQRLECIPSHELRSSVFEKLYENTRSIDNAYNNYVKNYHSFIVKYDSAKSLKRSWSGAAIGGAIGAFLGPVGAIVGGIAGGAMSDDKAGKELSSQVELMQSAWALLSDSVEGFIKHMLLTLVNIVEFYDRKLLEDNGSDNISFYANNMSQNSSSLNRQKVIESKNNSKNYAKQGTKATGPFKPYLNNEMHVRTEYKNIVGIVNCPHCKNCSSIQATGETEITINFLCGHCNGYFMYNKADKKFNRICI